MGISIVIILISLILLYQFTNTTEIESYNYQINQTTDYKVHISQNPYILSEYMEKNQTYISQIVKYISFDFAYEYYASQYAKLDYQYNITGTLYLDAQNTGQNLLKKKYNIIKDKYLQLEDTNKINISEKINIDYQQYNNEVQRFKEDFNLPVKAYLIVEFNVTTGIQTNIQRDNKTQEETISQMTIELNQPIFQITEQKTGNISNQIVNKEKDNLYLLLVYVTIFFTSIVYFIIQVRKTHISKYQKYQIELERILRKYKDIIVEILQEVVIENAIIVEVKDFNELLDVEEEIRQPILFFRKNEETAIFQVINNMVIYQYIVTILEDK